MQRLSTIIFSAALVLIPGRLSAGEINLAPAMDAIKSKNFALADQLLRPLADDDHAEAQFWMAHINECAVSGRKNETEMYDMYFRAAKAGHLRARRRLVEWVMHSGFEMKPGAAIGYTYRRYVKDPTPEAIDFEARSMCYGSFISHPCECFGGDVRKTMWTIISADLGNGRARLVDTFRPLFYSSYHYQTAESLARSYHAGELSNWMRIEYEAVLAEEGRLKQEQQRSR